MENRNLQRAQEHCFIAGVNDSGMKLCEANVPFGIAKIHHVQEKLGFPADATFVGAPDATVTRNVNRWKQGFSYGGMYQWSGDFHVLDLKVNACGMMVGTLPEIPDADDIRDRIHALDKNPLTLDGVTLDNDLRESNHFIDVFESTPQNNAQFAWEKERYFFIMHSSGHEHRSNTEHGIGLYWDQSDSLYELATRMETPWGILHILRGEQAEEWYRYYSHVQDFNHRRRAHVANYLFGEHQNVVNATHQGLVRNYNIANIGCYTFESGDAAENRIFPLTLSPYLPAYLVHAHDNFSDESIEALGWQDRIEKHHLWERIRDTNILPHGGGYTYEWLKRVKSVQQKGPDERVFELEHTAVDKDTKDHKLYPSTIENPRALPYSYRGMEVKDRMKELSLGSVVAELDLKYVVAT